MRLFLVGTLLVGMLGASAWLVSAATAPYFASASAKSIAENEIHRLGGGELIEFVHHRDDRYLAIYRRESTRIDIYVEGGKVSRVQTGGPLCNADPKYQRSR